MLTSVDDINPALPYLLRTLNYGNYGIFLIMGIAGFISSTVQRRPNKGSDFKRFDTQTLQEYGSFRKLGVPYFGVLIIRILLFRVLYQGPLFSETPI